MKYKKLSDRGKINGENLTTEGGSNGKSQNAGRKEETPKTITAQGRKQRQNH